MTDKKIEAGDLKRVEGIVKFYSPHMSVCRVETPDGRSLYPPREKLPQGVDEGDRVAITFGTAEGYSVVVVEKQQD